MCCVTRRRLPALERLPHVVQLRRVILQRHLCNRRPGKCRLQRILVRHDVDRVIDDLTARADRSAIPGYGLWNQSFVEFAELTNLLDVARAVTTAALGRTESRGSHQREDFPVLDDNWTCHQVIAQDGHGIKLSRAEVRRLNNTKVV